MNKNNNNNNNNLKVRSIKSSFEDEEYEEEEEDDEEFEQWELEQMKKGGGKRIQIPPSSLTQKTKQKAILPFQSSQTLSVDQAQKELELSLIRMQDNFTEKKERLEKISNEIQTYNERIQSIETSHNDSSKEYIFFKEMKDYTSNLCDCLAEKVKKKF